MNIDELPTPCLLLERGRLMRNVAAMAERMTALGVDLRPHLKASKSAEVARLATAGHSGGITVSTLNEAAYFAGHGFRDITLAVPIVAARFDAVRALVGDGVSLSVLVDSVATAEALAAASFESPLAVLIEIDCGLGRTGIAPDDAALLDIARPIADADGLALAGVLTHGGHSYGCRNASEIEAVAENERRAAVGAAERLRTAGHACPVVSVGSTPTAIFAKSLDGVTEARPGVYTFFDLFQAGLGCCTLDDVAVTVLTSVISHRRELGRLMIDAGALALSQDRSTQHQRADPGYGLVFDAWGRRAFAGLRVAKVNQEHGFVEAASDAIPFGELPIGSRLRIMPNHVCMTAAAYDRYHVVDGGDEVVAVWDRTNGW